MGRIKNCNDQRHASLGIMRGHNEEPPGTPRTSQHYGIERFKADIIVVNFGSDARSVVQIGEPEKAVTS